jgi:Na+-transporting methylmalonyl-CoA/oxaloacetate decarboxylase gamma subunit
MTSLAFGFTMLVVGMGGTLLTLWLLTLLIRGLSAILPPPADDDETKQS